MLVQLCGRKIKNRWKIIADDKEKDMERLMATNILFYHSNFKKKIVIVAFMEWPDSVDQIESEEIFLWKIL